MDFCTLFLGLTVLSLVLFYFYLTRNRGHLETLKVPMDKPFLFLGSPPHGPHLHLLHEDMLKKMRRYGKTFGRYKGIRPVLVTTDLDLVKSVLVKNFDCFSDITALEIEDRHLTLDVGGAEACRGLMMEPVEEVAEGMMRYLGEVVEKEKGNVVDLKPIFQGFAMDAIARCAFGLKTDAYRNPNHDLIRYGKQVFSNFCPSNWKQSILIQLFDYFPGAVKFVALMPEAYDKFFAITSDILSQRETSKLPGNDFMARLLEALREKREGLDKTFLQSLSEDSIIAQGTVFFVAGYETTSNALSTFCFNLATHPKVQEKLFAEISGKAQMDKMDAALKESLRLNGPATMHFRVCIKDCEIAPGIIVKKGMRVDMPIFASHHDPDYFPGPEEFNPERFLRSNAEKIPQFAFRPFGGGPRECIGIRFSIIEMKTAMVKLLLRYRLVGTEETRLDFENGDQLMLSYPSMKVKLEERK